MNTKWIFLLAVVVISIVSTSNALASRDPLGGGISVAIDPIPQTSRFHLTYNMPGAMRWQHSSPNLYAYVGNDPINYLDPLGLLGFFFFVSGTLSAPDEGAIPEAENVEVVGWDSTRGFYTESINAVGGALGTHNNNISGFRGTYVDSNGCKGTVALREGNAGPENGAAGVSGGAGVFNDSSGDNAVYAHLNGTSLGGNVSLGGGISGSSPDDDDFNPND